MHFQASNDSLIHWLKNRSSVWGQEDKLNVGQVGDMWMCWTVVNDQSYFSRGGGGGGWLHIFFWYGCTPWKPKESPKPGQVFSQITNPNPGQIIYIIKMRPKAGETWFLCKLTYSSVPNQCVSNIVEIMVLPPSKHACYIVLSILWWETGRENGSRTTHVPTPGRFFLFWMKTQPNAGAWQTL